MREWDIATGEAEIVGLPRIRLQQAARRLIKLRRLRAELFGRSLSREVAWDILLALYVNDRRFTIGNLTKAVGAPNTTVLRWLDYLHDRDFIERADHPTDGRAALVSLGDKATGLLETYLYEELTRM